MCHYIKVTNSIILLPKSHNILVLLPDGAQPHRTSQAVSRKRGSHVHQVDCFLQVYFKILPGRPTKLKYHPMGFIFNPFTNPDFKPQDGNNRNRHTFSRTSSQGRQKRNTMGRACILASKLLPWCD